MARVGIAELLPDLTLAVEQHGLVRGVALAALQRLDRAARVARARVAPSASSTWAWVKLGMAAMARSKLCSASRHRPSPASARPR